MKTDLITRNNKTSPDIGHMLTKLANSNLIEDLKIKGI